MFIEFKPRRSFDSRFSIVSENVVISNTRKADNMRYVNKEENKNKVITSDIVNIEGDSINVYCNETRLAEPFKMYITLDLASITNQEYNHHDPKRKPILIISFRG